jgi:hypothetical protein
MTSNDCPIVCTQADTCPELTDQDNVATYVRITGDIPNLDERAIQDAFGEAYRNVIATHPCFAILWTQRMPKP